MEKNCSCSVSMVGFDEAESLSYWFVSEKVGDCAENPFLCGPLEKIRGDGCVFGC